MQRCAVQNHIDSPKPNPVFTAYTLIGYEFIAEHRIFMEAAFAFYDQFEFSLTTNIEAVLGFS